MSRFHAIFVETGFFYEMANKKDKNKDKIWNEYDSVVRNAMWPISPTAYLFGRYLYDKIAGNPTEFNRALYSAVNPAGDPPEFSLKGVGNALVDMMFTNAKLLTGDYNNVWYKRNDDSIGNRVARAAWAKYNNLPYDETLIIDNGDGTYSLPESVTKKIRTERSGIEGAYKINKEKYDKILEGYRNRITSAIDSGNLEEIPVIQRERDNNDELKILEYAIDFDEHNLKGLESLEKNGYGVFNMFNTKDRNLRKELNTDLNILNDFTIRKNDDGTYSYEDMYDFFPLFHFLSNGKTFKIKGKIKKAGGGEIKTVSEDERQDFLKWYYDVATKKGLSLNPYGRNHYYDYELFWKNEPKLAKAMLEGDSDAHFTDKYKMPGHPTFSKESIYSNDEHEGGSWIKHNGVNYFVPSDFTKQYIERTNDYLYGTGEGFVDDRLDGEKKYMLLGVGDEAGRRTGTGFRGVPFKNPNMDWDAFTRRFHKMNRFGGGKERRVFTDNLEYLYEKLLEKGYTGNQIYTLMANAIEESGGDPKDGIDGTGYAGLFQESLQRYTQDERNRDSKLSDKEVIDNTVDRIDRHIRKGDGFLYYKGGFDNQKKAQEVFLDDDSSLEDVMRSFVYNFERTADPQGTYINRVNTARIIRDMVESNEKPEILNVPKVTVYDEGGYVANSDNTSVATGYRESLSSFGTFIPYEGGVLPEVNVYGKLTEQALRRAQARRGRNYVYQGQNEVAEPIINTVSAVGGFFPVIGEGMDAIDLYNALKNGDYEGVGLAAFGFIPGLGTLRDIERAHEATQYARRRLYFVDSPYRKYERPSKLTDEELEGIGRSNRPQPGHIRNREEFEKDLEALDQFAYKYGYIFNKHKIRTQSQLDEAYRNIIAQHNTFIRGVRADSREEAMRNMLPTTDVVGAGRYGWSKDDIPTTYVSNSYDSGMGYATGKGYDPEKQNGWIGRIRVNVDFDPSVPRREWLDMNNFKYAVDEEYKNTFIPDGFRSPIEDMVRRIDLRTKNIFKRYKNDISKEDLIKLLENDDGYSEYISYYIRKKRKMSKEKVLDTIKRSDKETYSIPTFETYANNSDRINFIEKYKNENAESYKEFLDALYMDDVKNTDPYILYLYNADMFNSKILSEDEFRKVQEDLIRNGYDSKKGATLSNESSIYVGEEISDTDRYIHYILTDPKSYSVTGLQNIGSVNRRDYTRRHTGRVGEDLSRKSFEEGGENDIRNYYASRDNTAVGAQGYDLNVGSITPSQDSDLTETVASFTPVIGDIMDLKSFHDSYKKGDKVGMLLSAAALLPVVGGFASKALKYKNSSDAAKYVLKNAKRDKELIDKFPSYANPNSPINDALGRHKLRLERGAYERLTGEEPHLVGFKNGKPQWGFGDIDFNVYNIRDKKDLKSLSDFYGTTEEELEKEFKDNSNLIFATLDRIIWDPEVLKKFPEDKEYWSRYLGKFDDEGEFGHIISHEVDHMVHFPDKPIGDDDGFDFSWMPDDMRNYFSMDNNAEISARGSQIKDYFGLTNDKQKITPEMLEYASRHYIDDYGVDNNMYEFFKSIKDYDKAAKWITENTSAGLGSLWLLDREVLKDDNKKDGGVIRFSKKLDGDSIFVKTSKRKVSVEELRKHTMDNDFIFPKRAIKYEDGGLNDIRNYYASRDNTSVGAPGYDLNVGNIKPSQSFDITETVASFLPGVGDVIDARDLMESAKDKDVMGMALALSGFIPVAGDAAQEYFRLLRESRGLDRGKRFIRNDIKETDDELLEKMPSYAHPNSPMADAMVFHKMRLDNDGYNKVVGGYTPGLDYRMRDLNQTYPGIYDKAFDVDYVFDPKSKDTRALVGITYGLSDDVVKKMSDDEIMNHVRRLQFKLNANNPMFSIGNKGDRATVYSSSGFEQRFPFGGDDALNAAKSHELEHAVRNNADTPVTKEMADEAKEWFSFSSDNELYDEYMNNPLELLARGSQIKDYFGLTSSKQKVTPEMLKYFSRHYAFDVFDNDMTNFVKGIKDWDKAAKWISEYPTVYGGAAIVSKALEEGDNEAENMDGSSEMESGGVVFPNDNQSMSGNGLYRPLLYPYMISKRKKFIKNLMKSKYGISESDSESLIDNMAKKTLLDSDYYDLKNKEYGIASLKGDDLKEFISTYKNGGLIDQVDFIAKKFKRGDYRQFMELGGLVEKQDKLFETLTDNYGIPDLQAVAIVANLTHESNLDPYVTGDSGDSYGIQQWRDARRMALWDFARNRHHVVPTYEDQVDFLMNEFNQGKSFQFDDKGKNLYQSGIVKNPTFDYYQYSKNDFMNASNLYDAVIAWNQGAGRPSKKYAMNDRRFEIAKEIAERNGIEYDPVSHYSEMGYRSVGNEDITGLEQAVEENPEAAEVVAETASVADREEGAPPAGATQKERENWLISHYEDAILQQAISSDGLRNKMDRMDKEISALKNQIESEEQEESEAIKESEQKRREREFLASVLSNVQLNIKGVSQIERS